MGARDALEWQHRAEPGRGSGKAARDRESRPRPTEGAARIRTLRERRDCPGLVHIITPYAAQYVALGEEEARRVLRPGIVRDADPGLREHELYAYSCNPYNPYNRMDQPAVAHEDTGDRRGPQENSV